VTSLLVPLPFHTFLPLNLACYISEWITRCRIIEKRSRDPWNCLATDAGQ